MSVNIKGLKYNYLIINTNTEMPSHLQCDVRQVRCPEEVTATVGVTMPTMPGTGSVWCVWSVSVLSGYRAAHGDDRRGQSGQWQQGGDLSPHRHVGDQLLGQLPTLGSSHS